MAIIAQGVKTIPDHSLSPVAHLLPTFASLLARPQLRLKQHLLRPKTGMENSHVEIPISNYLFIIKASSSLGESSPLSASCGTYIAR